VPNLFLFAVLHNFYHYFDSFDIKIGDADISALFNNTRECQKTVKAMQLGQKEANFWYWAKFSTGATFSPELNLSRCYI